MDTGHKVNDNRVDENENISSDEILARSVVLDSLGVSYVFDDAAIRKSTDKKKKKRTSAARMNMLDHDGALLAHLRTGLVGAGIFSMLQGLFMSSFLSFFIGALSGAGGMVSGFLKNSFIKTGMQYLNPVISETQQYLDMGRNMGLPVDDLRNKMIAELPKHAMPKRLMRYALFTMLGQGGVSFWLGATGIGALALTSPTTLTSILGVSSSVTMIAKAVILSGPDILQYRAAFHPDFVMARIDSTLKKYGIHANTAEVIHELSAINISPVRDKVQEIAMGLNVHSCHGLYEKIKNTPTIMQTATQIMEQGRYQKNSILGTIQQISVNAGIGTMQINNNVESSFRDVNVDGLVGVFENAISGMFNKVPVHV